jgi:hypothetical protein
MSGQAATSFLSRLAVICAGVAATAWATHLAVARALPLERFAGKGYLRLKVGHGLHVGVPALAALVLFLALCVLLRMEEYHAVVQWVRGRGWKKKAGNSATAGD